MRNEIFRLLKSKTIWAASLIAIVVFFAFAMLYSAECVSSENKIYHDIESYASAEEIPALIEELKEARDAIDGEEEKFKESTDYVDQCIAIYEYLYEHEISYETFERDYATIIGASDYEDSFVSYAGEMLDLSGNLLMLLSVISATLIVCNDFEAGVEKNVYGTNRDRSGLFKGKLGACLLYDAAMMLLFIVLTLVTSTQFATPAANLICFFENRLIVVGPQVYVFLNCLFQFASMVPTALLILGISSMMKNTYANLVTCVAACAVPRLLSLLHNVSSRNWYVLAMPLMDMFAGYYPSWVFLIMYFAELLVSLAFFFIGFNVFSRRNI